MRICDGELSSLIVIYCHCTNMRFEVLPLVAALSLSKIRWMDGIMPRWRMGFYRLHTIRCNSRAHRGRNIAVYRQDTASYIYWLSTELPTLARL